VVTIIIPIYNEEKNLLEKIGQFRNLSKSAELIFVDGKSSDNSCSIAVAYGKILHSKAGRAAQMNSGVTQARGDILLFLHADNIILTDTLETIERKITEDGYIGGCLTQRIDNNALIYRLIEWQGNTRARLTREFYGDQGIFVKKNTFLRMGGFPEVPIMEDVLFSRRLRTIGKTVVLSDKITVSARRWEKNGIIKTALIFNLIIILFWLKAPLHKIKQFYEDIR